MPRSISTVARLGVGQRAVRAARRRSRESSAPARPERRIRSSSVDRHLTLAAPDQPAFEHAAERLVGELGWQRDMRRSPARPLPRADAPPSRRTARAPSPAPSSSRRRACCLTVSARVVEAEPALPLDASLPERTRRGLEQLAGRDLALEGLRAPARADCVA